MNIHACWEVRAAPGGRNPEVGPDRDHGGMLCPDLLGLLPYIQDYLTGNDTIYSELGPSTSISNKENAPTDLSTDQSGGSISSTEIPSSRMTLARAKWIQTNRYVYHHYISPSSSSLLSLSLCACYVVQTSLELQGLDPPTFRTTNMYPPSCLFLPFSVLSFLLP